MADPARFNLTPTGVARLGLVATSLAAWGLVPHADPPAASPSPGAPGKEPAPEDQGQKDAVALVKLAIAYHKQHGRKALVLEVSRTRSQLRKGRLYVFVYDMKGTVVAHGQFARLAGYDLSGFHDPNGKAYIQERIRIAREKGHGWQDYVFLNPETKNWEPKRAYIERSGDLIFGCGVYRK